MVQDGVLSYQFPALGEGSLLYGDVESKIGELNTTLYVDGTYRCKYSCWLSYLVFAVLYVVMYKATSRSYYQLVK